MYWITIICALAIGIPHYLLAQEAQVICTKNGVEVGKLFNGVPISVDGEGNPKIFPSQHLTNLCQKLYPDEAISAAEEGASGEDTKVKATLKEVA